MPSAIAGPRSLRCSASAAAHAYLALRQPGVAREHWRSALDILTHRGIDQTEDEETTTAAIHAHRRLTQIGGDQ